MTNTRVTNTLVEAPTDLTIDEGRCRVLLGSVRVARVAFVDQGLPQLVVMNHHVHGTDVLLRTSADSRLAGLTDRGGLLPVALEVDSLSAADRSGWSVVAAGSLARDDAVAGPGTVQRSGQGLPAPWRSGAFDVVLRLRIDQLSGVQIDADV